MSTARKPKPRRITRLISVSAAAERATVTQRTIWRWIADGRLPAYRVGSTLVRVDEADVDAMITPIAAARQ